MNFMDLIPAEWRPGTSTWEAMCQGVQNGLTVLLAILGIAGVVAFSGSSTGSTGSTSVTVSPTTTSTTSTTTTVPSTGTTSTTVPTTSTTSTSVTTSTVELKLDSRIMLVRGTCSGGTTYVYTTVGGASGQTGDQMALYLNGVLLSQVTVGPNKPLVADKFINNTGPITLKGVYTPVSGVASYNEQSFPAC